MRTSGKSSLVIQATCWQRSLILFLNGPHRYQPYQIGLRNNGDTERIHIEQTMVSLWITQLKRWNVALNSSETSVEKPSFSSSRRTSAVQPDRKVLSSGQQWTASQRTALREFTVSTPGSKLWNAFNSSNANTRSNAAECLTHWH